MTRRQKSLSRASLSATVTRQHRAQAFFALLSIVIVTVVFYDAIRNQPAELSFDQRAALQTHIHFLSNATAFLPPPSTVQGDPSILSSLSPETWSSLGPEISHVVLLRTSHFAPFVQNDEWFGRSLKMLEALPAPQSIGIALFDCGCVIPGAWFRRQPVRFSGYECWLLPGFVMPRERVVWVGERGKEPSASGVCDMSVPGNWVEQYEQDIVRARKEWHHVLEQEMDAISKSSDVGRMGLRHPG